MASPEGWRIRAATVAGASHVEADIGGDDAYAYALAPSGGVVVAVADGAGSRSGTSAHGAYAACQAIVALADDLLTAVDGPGDAEQALQHAFATARAAVAARAAELGLDVRDLATTLAVAVFTPEASYVAQVGDGIIVCEVGDTMRSLVPEEKGEYANEVVFLTVETLEAEVRTARIDPPVRRFALSTDGLRYKILRLHDGGAPYEPFFAAMWRTIDDGDGTDAELGEWLAGLDDQTGDDKTLVIGARVTGTGPEATVAGSPEPPPLASPTEDA